MLSSLCYRKLISQQIGNYLFNNIKKIIVDVNFVQHCSTIQNKNDTEAERIVWIDLEMSGLKIEKDRIMEIACIITDSKLNIVAEGPDIVIHQPPEILENMNEWCIKNHAKTGLTEACRNSKISIEEAEKTVLEFFHKYIQPGMSPLAGNSVYTDRLFLMKYMPKVNNYMHYRIIDVSSIKELCRRWNPEIYQNAPKKQMVHRSLSDIKESITELQWYKKHFLKTQNV